MSEHDGEKPHALLLGELDHVEREADLRPAAGVGLEAGREGHGRKTVRVTPRSVSIIAMGNTVWGAAKISGWVMPQFRGSLGIRAG